MESKEPIHKLSRMATHYFMVVVSFFLFYSFSLHPIQAKAAEKPELTVINSWGKTLKYAAVQGGVPFAQGRVRDVRTLRLDDANGEPVPVQARPLAYWGDGSVKWAELTFYLRNLAAAETRRLSLSFSEAKGSRLDAPRKTHHENAEFKLVDSSGETAFVATNSHTIAHGNLYEETIFHGTFHGREGRTEGSLSVARFPGVKAVRYRPYLKQLVNGETWRSLTLAVPHPHAAVRWDKQVGSTIGESTAGKTTVTLIAQTAEAVDRGVGRRWEVWGFDDPSLFQTRTLQPQVTPEYLRATGALARLVLKAPRNWENGFEQNVAKVYAKRNANPKNFGWRHYGDFFDREHSLVYYGYLNQQYDPATALFLAHARTGKLDYLEKAEELASLFRDMIVSPEGWIYTHQATNNAADAHVISLIAEAHRQKIVTHPSFRPSDTGLIEAIKEIHGENAGSMAKKLLNSMKNDSFEEKLAKLVQLYASTVLKEEVEKLKSAAPKNMKAPTDLRWVYQRMTTSRRLNELGYKDVEKSFEPFFKRYGGSWEDFPAFQVDIHPDETKQYSGTHSIVELLVLAYFFTGDEGFRESALKVARHHVDSLVPDMLRYYKQQMATGQKYIGSRGVSWPLINLIALNELTDRRDGALNRAIKEKARSLAYFLTGIPLDRHEGGLHSGIGMEALARYHALSDDDNIAQYLIEWARYVLTAWWDDQKKGVRYLAANEGFAWDEITALNLFGLAYANNLSPDGNLKKRILQARDSISNASTSYAKSFAMLYRSSPRALAIIEEWTH